MKTLPWNVKLLYIICYISWSKKTYSTKMNIINCILLVLLLLVSMALLKCTNFPLVIHFLKFVELFHLYVQVSASVIYYDDTCRDTFSFVSQIKNAIFSRKFFVSYDVTSFSTNISLQETIDIVRDDIESIKSNFIKNGYPPFLIDKVMKKYLNYTFSSNQNQLKDTSDVHSSY